MARLTEAQRKYLEGVPESLPGRRTKTPAEATMYRRLEAGGLIEPARFLAGTPYFIKTEAGCAALASLPQSSAPDRGEG